MSIALSVRTEYTRAERVSDALLHAFGLLLAAGAVPVLIVLAALLRRDYSAVAGTSIYGATLFVMVLASTLYNTNPDPRWHGVLQRIDHSAIYLKIAGTYTPFALITGHGLWLTAALWGAAFIGVALKAISPVRFRVTGLVLYLGMGWAGIFAGGDMLAVLEPGVAQLMMTGGLLYTMGVGFYLMDRLPFHYTIWHVFVLAATGMFYAALVVQVTSVAA